ncbi:MAG: aspartate-semialdehyde dehydrogenase [Erysipelotrichaceae bacterium]|jgi:aspartate-semialdehyde dehydrogenase
MRIGILGATGAVGQQMMQCLVEQDIKVDELRLLASYKSVGKELQFKGKTLKVIEAKEDSFDGLDVVLGAAGRKSSEYFAPFIKKAKAVFIDNSSAFRMDEEVPLIIPEINGEDVKKHNGIIASPNCSTIIAFMALYGINKKSKLTKMIVSTYQAVSGAGIKGIAELENQIEAISSGGKIENHVFAHQIAYNCIPAIGTFLADGYTDEEMKMQNEGRKIMHLPHLDVTCTCVRVPIIKSHSISISFATEKPLTIEEVRKAISDSKGIRLMDDGANNVYPMPVNTTDNDIIEVGRIREDKVIGGFSLFCCGNQIRKGAASNTVAIIKCL